MRIEAFDFLKDVFSKNGFHLYVVGGMLIFKLAVTFLVVTGLVCAWFFWVMR